MYSHAHHIGHICAETHTVKQLRQGVKLTMEVVRPRQRENPIICVKVCHQMLHVTPKTLRVSRSWVHRLLRRRHHGDPVSEDSIYNHIEDSGR